MVSNVRGIYSGGEIKGTCGHRTSALNSLIVILYSWLAYLISRMRNSLLKCQDILNLESGKDPKKETGPLVCFFVFQLEAYPASNTYYPLELNNK